MGTLVWMLAAVTQSTVYAQESTPSTPLRTEASQYFRRGVEHTERGELEQAVADFERAFQIEPHESVLYNLGLLFASLERPTEAVAVFERYLQFAPSRVSESRKAEVLKLIAEQRARQAVLLLSVVPGHARIQFDGRDLEQGEQHLDPGSHDLRVTAPGYEPLHRSLELRTGEHETLKLELSGRLKLRVKCELSGVALLLEGREIGRTNGCDEFESRIPGGGQLLLRAAGYGDQTVTLGSRGTQSVRCRLEPKARDSARLHVLVSESGSRQWLDGRPYGGGRVAPGRHVLRVERHGFEPWSSDVTLEPGQERTVEVELTPTDAYRASVERRARFRRSTSYVLAGTGALLAAGGGVVYVHNTSRHQLWRTRSEKLPPRTELTDEQRAEQHELDVLEDSTRLWDNLARGLLVVGTVAVGAGVGLYLTGADPGWHAKSEPWSLQLYGSTLSYRRQF